MLQEVQGITPSAAAGIAAVFPTFRALMEGYEKAERRGGVDRAEGMLADCEVCDLPPAKTSLTLIDPESEKWDSQRKEAE